MKTIEIMMDDERVEQVDRIAKRDGISWDEAATKLIELAVNEMWKEKAA
ncbi:MAG: hypothetical protein H8E62_03725 [Planctomycetes bacterium]|nr:hypothetical protein [Planctomycetota bacterium]